MNVGEAAAASGVSAKMIRHYEAIGLIRPAARSGNNYRTYGADDVHILRFIRRARDLGFSIAETRRLLALWQEERPSAEVKTVTLTHIAALDRKIAALRAMRDTLRHLAEHCRGDDRPSCPILAELSETSESSAGRPA